MDTPKKFDEKSIRNEKVKVIKSVEKIKEENIVFGQYKNYTDEKGIKKKSKTETFFALKLFINNKKWKNTPFFLRSGKNMKKSFASIYIQFKNQQNTNSKKEVKPDYLVIQIQPKSGVSEHIKNKLTKKQLGIKSLKHSFYKEKNSTNAYEILIYKALEGDQSLFIRSDEIEDSWKIIDKIKRTKIKTYTYEKNSFGPKESESLLENKRKWFNTIENI